MRQSDTPSSQGTVLIVSIGIATLLGAIFWGVEANAKAAAFSLDRIRCDFIAEAGLHRALWEIDSRADDTGEGIGAMGLAAPVPFTASDGALLGEYRTTVSQIDNQAIVLSVAAIPSFADPEIFRAVEGLLVIQPRLLFAPEPGAIYVAGPVTQPEFLSMGSGTVHIDGGAAPAITSTSATTYDSFIDAFGDLLYSGDLSGSEFSGTSESDFSHAEAGTITLRVLQQDSEFLSAATMNNYRNQLRTAILHIAASSNRTITSPISGDKTWGTANYPDVTVIEANTIGMDDVFGTDGQTITGYGTLIIKDTIRPGANGNDLNIDWTGDIYVLGGVAAGDDASSDLLYLRGTQGFIHGNLILLASDGTGPSLEMTDSGNRPSNLTINGAVLALAEANSHGSER